ncbi:MAG: phosphoglycerate kinase [Desulfurococcales archaeon]|nr:phosphoglycerate kinase [Desulfurococcales archaeon]
MPLSVRGLTIPLLDDLPPCRRVIVRIDVNSPIDPGTGEILDATRFRAHRETLRELAERAAVVAISHQGRPGEQDFTTLERHARVLEEATGLPVEYVDDVIGPEALRRIRGHRPGGILLLDNSRLVSEDFVEAPAEVHARGIMVSRLAPLFDCYVNDAFSVSHRSQASVVGFPLRLPSAAGRLMERELRALARVLEGGGRPRVYVIGGSKIRDMVAVIEHALAKGAADKILTTGLTALLFLQAKGYDVGGARSALERKGAMALLGRASRLVREYGDSLMVPLDFLVETEDGEVRVEDAGEIRGAPKDIGPKTVEAYTEALRGAAVVVMKGPAGVIEDPRFRGGTIALVRAALESGAYTLFGGGHFNVIISELPEELRGRVGHISTAGGALVYMLAGRSLPGLEALARSALSRGEARSGRGGG